MRKRTTNTLTSMIHVLMPPFLLADMVWPALILEQRLLSVIPISAGLIVEWLVLWFGGFGLTWKRAAVIDVVMNATSSIVGVFLIPALGFAWEFFPGMIIQKVFNVGTFNPITWAGTFFLAVLATTVVEGAVVFGAFKVALDRRRVLFLTLANSISVGFAFVSLWINPPRF